MRKSTSDSHAERRVRTGTRARVQRAAPTRPATHRAASTRETIASNVDRVEGTDELMRWRNYCALGKSDATWRFFSPNLSLQSRATKHDAGCERGRETAVEAALGPARDVNVRAVRLALVGTAFSACESERFWKKDRVERDERDESAQPRKRAFLRLRERERERRGKRVAPLCAACAGESN